MANSSGIGEFKPNLTWDEEVELTYLSIELKEIGSKFEKISVVIGNFEIQKNRINFFKK